MSDYREMRELTTSKDPNGAIIDMTGPAAEISIYGHTHNIVLLPTPASGTNTVDYLAALKIYSVGEPRLSLARRLGITSCRRSPTDARHQGQHHEPQGHRKGIAPAEHCPRR